MNENVDPRAASRASNAPKQDLRAWLAQMEAAGDRAALPGARARGDVAAPPSASACALLIAPGPAAPNSC